MYHRLEVIGHLGNDPEMRYLPNGKPVTKLSIATSRRYTKEDGTAVEDTVWFRVSVFGKQAEHCNTYLRKGKLVFVEGHLQADTNGSPKIFLRKDGTSGASFEIIANNVRFLSSNDQTTSVNNMTMTPPINEQTNPAPTLETLAVSSQEQALSAANCPF
jgi:single-strand DNA-binding protein